MENTIKRGDVIETTGQGRTEFWGLHQAVCVAVNPLTGEILAEGMTRVSDGRVFGTGEGFKPDEVKKIDMPLNQRWTECLDFTEYFAEYDWSEL